MRVQILPVSWRKIQSRYVFRDRSKQLPRIQHDDLTVRVVIWAPHVKCERTVRSRARSWEGAWVRPRFRNHLRTKNTRKRKKTLSLLLSYISLTYQSQKPRTQTAKSLNPPAHLTFICCASYPLIGQQLPWYSRIFGRFPRDVRGMELNQNLREKFRAS
jgi:hypothetical protein